MSNNNKQNDNRKNNSNIFKDDVLLRRRKGTIDKTIGSEGEMLAEKRLAALKHLRQDSSSKTNNVGETSSSPSTGNIAGKSLDSNTWQQLGPTLVPNGQTYSDKYYDKGIGVNISGRITSIVIHPTDSNIIYVGAAQGGVWKSTNGGNSWTPTSDNLSSLAIGALVIDESNPNVLYVGTGEGNFALDSQYGHGIAKTTDGAQKWELKAFDIFKDSRFNRIAINSKYSSTIFAALSYPAAGIYRSTDGGEKWIKMTNILPPNDTTDATDIVLNRNTPDIAYAAFHDKGIFMTENANDANPRWNRLNNGLPVDGFGRVVLGISRSSPNILYALMADGNDELINQFYRTNDNGNTWKKISLPGYNLFDDSYPDSIGEQGWYNLNVAVHPTNPDIAYLSGVSLWKAEFTEVTSKWIIQDIGKEFHADNHTLAFDPHNPEIIYAGSDGGIYKSVDGGKNWADSINQGLCITQFEFMEQDPTNEGRIILGVQDNGTLLYNGKSTFEHIDDGDGGYVCIDQVQPKYVWHTRYGMRILFSEQSGDRNTWNFISEDIYKKDSNFYPPLALDKTNSNNIAVGGNKLYLSHKRGDTTWEESEDLHISPEDFISAINYVKSDLIYVGTNFGKVYRLVKNSASWSITKIDSPPLPSRYIWDLATMPNDETKIVAVVSGFLSSHVFYGEISSDCSSATWKDISPRYDNGDIIDIPVNAIAIDNNNSNVMYIGTDLGVFRTHDGGIKWVHFSEGLPNCQVYDLRLISNRVLRAATHGRGLWERKI